MSKLNIALDASQLHEYMMCPLKWFYRYYCNLELPQVTSKREAPDMGTLMHAILDSYYNLRLFDPSGNKMVQANACVEFFKASKITAKLFPNEVDDMEDFIARRFGLYVQNYIFNDLDVIPGGVELGFSKLLYEDAKVRFIVEGRIDLMNRLWMGNIFKRCFTDHKTSGLITDLYPYKIQFKTYAWATGAEYGMINYIGMQEDKTNKLLKEKKLFRRTLINFKKEMIEEWEQTMMEKFEQIYHILRKEMTIEKGFYLLRNEAECSGAYDSHPCQFCAICEEYNWDNKAMVKASSYKKVAPWSPWNPKINGLTKAQ